MNDAFERRLLRPGKLPAKPRVVQQLLDLRRDHPLDIADMRPRVVESGLDRVVKRLGLAKPRVSRVSTTKRRNGFRWAAADYVTRIIGKVVKKIVNAIDNLTRHVAL